MPELPEIETVKLQLERVMVGQKCAKYKVLGAKIVRGNLDVIVGKKVEGLERRGKVLLIKFGESFKLGFHFKMTGQLIYEDGKKRVVGGHPTEDFENPMPGKHTRVIFYFDRGTLFFNDQRMFGWVEMNPKFVDKLGPEPFEMTVEQLGVLLEKVKLVLREGIKYGGATYSDYVNVHGLGGHYQDHFRTYDRDGKKCLRDDGGIIVKFDLGGRGTYMCPKCQR